VETDSVIIKRARGLVDVETALIIPPVYNLIIEPGNVRVLLDVQELSERTFNDIPVTFIGTDRPQRFLAQPRTVSVTVRGGVELVEQLSGEDIRLVVDLSLYIPDSLTPVEPRVELPEGLTPLRIEPASVRVTEY
jgi:YbbR domain-containing protein